MWTLWIILNCNGGGAAWPCLYITCLPVFRWTCVLSKAFVAITTAHDVISQKMIFWYSLILFFESRLSRLIFFPSSFFHLFICYWFVCLHGLLAGFRLSFGRNAPSMSHFIIIGRAPCLPLPRALCSTARPDSQQRCFVQLQHSPAAASVFTRSHSQSLAVAPASASTWIFRRAGLRLHIEEAESKLMFFFN